MGYKDFSGLPGKKNRNEWPSRNDNGLAARSSPLLPDTGYTEGSEAQRQELPLSTEMYATLWLNIVSTKGSYITDIVVKGHAHNMLIRKCFLKNVLRKNDFLRLKNVNFFPSLLLFGLEVNKILQ